MTLQAGSFELQAAGSKGSDNRNLYIYGDHLGSAVLALDANQKEAMRLGYSPFGQVYRKQNDTKFWKLNSGVNANNQLNQLMPYQYTGRYTEGATGYTNLDARWYNPYTQRFNQPDYWSFNNTGLPLDTRHELMRVTGLSTALLLRDPAQQMRYGYAGGNALNSIDLTGLCPAGGLICGAVAVASSYVIKKTPGAVVSGLANFNSSIAQGENLTDAIDKGLYAFATGYLPGDKLSAVAVKTYTGSLVGTALVDGESVTTVDAQIKAAIATSGAILINYPINNFITGMTPTIGQMVLGETTALSYEFLANGVVNFPSVAEQNYCPAP